MPVLPQKNIKTLVILPVIMGLLTAFYLSGMFPRKLAALPFNDGLQVRLTWEHGLLPGKYDVYRRELPGGRFEKVYETSRTFFLDKKVVPGNTYIYKVVNVHGLGLAQSTLEIRVNNRYAGLKERLLNELDGHFKGSVNQRWIYDDALGVLVYTLAGEQKKAGRILNNLKKIQNPNGSINFYYFLNGEKDGVYIRNGALAWVGYAAAVYQVRFQDKSFQPFTEKIAGYLNLSGAAAGRVTGGEGLYPEGGGYIPGKAGWYSTEHNIDAFFFYQELFKAAGRESYSETADKIRNSLMDDFWDSRNRYFKTGLNDGAFALDTLSWGGIFLLNTGQEEKTDRIKDWLENYRVAFREPGGVVSGYTLEKVEHNRKYSRRDIWVEGSWGAVLYLLRRGEDVSPLLNSMEKIYLAEDTTISDKAWGYLVLKDPSFIWSEE